MCCRRVCCCLCLVVRLSTPHDGAGGGCWVGVRLVCCVHRTRKRGDGHRLRPAHHTPKTSQKSCAHAHGPLAKASPACGHTRWRKPPAQVNVKENHVLHRTAHTCVLYSTYQRHALPQWLHHRLPACTRSIQGLMPSNPHYCTNTHSMLPITGQCIVPTRIPYPSYAQTGILLVS